MSWNSLEDALTLGYGIERQFKCHVHQENNASASVNAVSGLWVCYSCGAKGKVDPNNVKISPEAVQREVRKALRILEADGHQYYAEAWLSIYDGSGPGEYWLSRFSAQMCTQFRLGFDPLSHASVYPLRDTAGRVLGVVQRNNTEVGPKYKYPHGADTSALLFNYHACAGDELVIVEGATDTIAAVEAGAQSMALYGSRVSYAQRRLFARYAPKRIWMGTDQDEAGERAWFAMRSALPHVDVRRMRWDGAKDLAAIPIEQRIEVLDRHGVRRVGSSPCGSSESRSTRPPEPSRSTRRRVTLLRRPTTA